jgi:hypothetical protein
LAIFSSLHSVARENQFFGGHSLHDLFESYMSDLYKLRGAFHDDLTYTAKELPEATRRHRQNQDRDQFAGLAHRATAEAAEFAGRVGSGMVRFPAALGMTWKQGAHPCVSPGRSIHAGVDQAED